MGKGKKDWYYGIYEVYYNKDGDITAITEAPIEPIANSFEELRGEMGHMMSALGKPVLDYDEIEFKPWSEEDSQELDHHVKGTQCC
jgi:hypothetical protein